VQFIEKYGVIEETPAAELLRSLGAFIRGLRSDLKPYIVVKGKYLRAAGWIGAAALLSAFAASPRAATPDSKQIANQAAFDANVAGFVKQNCAMCHNEQLKTAGLALTKYHDTPAMLHDRVVWEKVVARLRTHEMPPKGMPQPAPEQVATVTDWIEAQFAQFDQTSKPDPGHLTAHRLNRAEYNNTVRDLLAVKFKPAADFPADDSGYGFDNIGDVLSVSPVLMEKYLAAAKKIAGEAIPSGALPKATRMRYSPDHPLKEIRLELEHRFDLPAEGDYDLRAAVSGRKDAFRIQMELDGKPIQTSDIVISEGDKPRAYEIRLHVPYGEHLFSAALTEREPSPEEVQISEKLTEKDQQAIARQIAKNPADEKEIRKQHELGNPPTYMDSLEMRGPFNPLPPPTPESYKRIFMCGHAEGEHTPACMRANLNHLMRLAYRRPVTNEEVAKLTDLVGMAQKNGLTLDQSMRIGLQAILVSPNFLYRMERDPNPNDPAEIHPVNAYELASRLSYFLWSSMPDEELLQLAAEKRLYRPEVLHAQVKRMLADPKADALVDNFAGQWLELRNLDSAHPDPDQFPEFDEQLRRAMYTETRLFVNAIVHQDRSILDFIDGQYTFLNERLAKFYGIPGIKGKNFRRVQLDGTERSGVLTQGSVLLVTSYPTRTSPVLRGKWILENVLNTPPPPPPPGVGSIDAKGGALSGTMRQQMEKHRANPMCAGCHSRMDPLGFALENYNAIGEWRTEDASQPIDASGVLPGGRKFNGSAEMKKILAANREAFAECLTEKLMIYALGRGLEPYDRTATKKIVAQLASHEYRFSSLITGIVDSVPFQMGRGDGGNGK
jgi:mono/diheme cytochrome c family protein